MPRKVIIALMLVVGLAFAASAAEIISFKGTGTAAEPDPLMLTAKLTKPDGGGPFPAVVMLHGCGGILLKRDNPWAERLSNWGYVALQVDSFRPRGVSNICADRSSNSRFIPKRVRDAYDAKDYLSGLSIVDRNRIAVMGWSHGGWATLRILSEKERDPFRAAIAFYPWCDVPMADLNAPLSILIGDADDWCPSKRCVSRIPSGKTTHEITTEVYSGAYHGFDGKGMNRWVQGVTGSHRLLYNKEAAEDAIVRVKDFLEKYLKQ
jgi:dienelactone hydrolase